MKWEVPLRAKLVEAGRERPAEILVKSFSRQTVACAEHGEFVEEILVGQPRAGGEEVGYIILVVSIDGMNGLVEAFGQDSGGEEEGVNDFGDAGGEHGFRQRWCGGRCRLWGG